MSDTTKPRDENDKLRAGDLPTDPFEGARPVLHVVDPNKQNFSGPHNAVAEEGMLAALLWAGSYSPSTVRVEALADILLDGSKEFIDPKHRYIYEAMIACHAAVPMQEHEPVAVHAQLVVANHDAAVGGVDALRTLMAKATTRDEHQVRAYASIVHGEYLKRYAIYACGILSKDATRPNMTGEHMIERAFEFAKKFSEKSGAGTGVVTAKESALAFFQALQRANQVGQAVFATGLRDVDRMLNGGLRPDEFSILAARTNVGKSMLAAQIAEHIAAQPGYAALYVTLEMPHKSFTARLVAREAGVGIGDFRRVGANGYNLSNQQWSDVATAAGVVSNTNLFYADSRSQTIASVHAIARTLSKTLQRAGKCLSLIVIDHVGLIKPPDELLRKKATREQQVADTSRTLGVMATELHCHVMGIAQIHRDSERQGGGKAHAMPKLHHLRESGSLEQDPDLVFILHRERDSQTGQFVQDVDKPPALALAKGRMDETDIVLLDFEPSKSRFLDYNTVNADGSARTYWGLYGVDA